MKIETLEYILITSRFPTISIAAEKQFISQTTLSSAIKQVEAVVGYAIFERTPKGIALTEKGAEFIRLTEEIVQNYRKILALAETSQFQRVRRIVAHPVACFRYSVPLVQMFHSLAPGICLSVMEVPSQQIISLMEEREYDFGIGYAFMDEEETFLKDAKNAKITAEPMVIDETYAYVGPSSRFYHRESIQLSELKGAHLAFSKNCMNYYFRTKLYKITPSHSIFGDAHLVRQAVEQSDMVTFFMSSKEGPDSFCEHTSLKKLRFEKPAFAPMQHYLLAREDKKRNENDELLLQCIRSTILRDVVGG